MSENNEHAHPLLKRQVNRIKDWKSWKQLWEEAKTYEELLGLLHAGFLIDLVVPGEDLQRFCFYLDIAHGYRSQASMGKVWRKYSMGGSLEQSLAQKAWKVLCDSVFAHPKKFEFGYEHYHDYLLSDASINHLVAFFLDADNIPSGGDHGLAHHNEVARKFLGEYVQWLWKQGVQKKPADNFARFYRRLRPNLVSILVMLDMEDFFIKPDTEIDHASFARLKDIALGKACRESIGLSSFPNITKALASRYPWTAASRAARAYLVARVVQAELKASRQAA